MSKKGKRKAQKKNNAQQTTANRKNNESKSKIIPIVVILSIILCVIAAVAIIMTIMSNNQSDMTNDKSNKTYYADIHIKDYGKITVKLDPSAAPKTVDNFINLANSKFYDGLTFHRIIKDFMMQGGDAQGTEKSSMAKNIVGEFKQNGYDNPISHVRGTISMARVGGDPDSADSQFFIVHKDSLYLDGQYAAFGTVTEGMDVVDRICEEAQPVDNDGTIAEDQQPVINSIRIRSE